MSSWLVRSPPDRAVQVRALAGDIVSCSWTTSSTRTYSSSRRPTNAGDNPAID